MSLEIKKQKKNIGILVYSSAQLRMFWIPKV